MRKATRLHISVSLTLILAAMLAGCDDEGTPDAEGQADAGRSRSISVDAAMPAPELPDAEPPPEMPDAAPPQDPPDSGPPYMGDGPAPFPDNYDPVREPPPPPMYSMGECPMLVHSPVEEGSMNEGFVTGGTERAFRLLVPDNYDPDQRWPVVFAWHWLNARGSSFIREGELESAIAQMGFIVVLPEALRNESDDRVYGLTWPFAEAWGADAELTFSADMLACVTEQFNVDTRRVYGIGVSAGGLWVTFLSSTEQVDHFAAIESISGGLGDVFGAWRMEYTPQENVFPSLVLWGGPLDWLALSFQDASLRLIDELRSHDHFVVQCTHEAGHGVPPIEVPEGDTKFRSLWRFMMDHPYGLEPGWSPYLETGLPDVFPEWCSISE